jgi:vitamin B12 transporter
MTHRSLHVALAAIAFASGKTLAQSTDTAQLGTVVVSASKVPRPAGSLSQAVTVISGADLRARGVTRVSDALREVPGATLVQSGSYGAVTSLFLRGGESRYTKVLIDGVAVNAPGGSFDFSHLTTDNIDRIEIVRGPASVLYGADAVSGIIQIFTRRGDASRVSIGARGGTYQSLDLEAGVSAASRVGGFTAAAAQHSSDGILPFNNEYSNGTLSSSLSLAKSASGDASLSARYTTAEFHYPTDFTGAPVDTNSYRVQHRLTVGFDAGRNLRPILQARLLAGSNDVIDLTEDITTPFGASSPLHSASRSRSYRRNVEGRLAVFLPARATLTLGTAYESERERSANSAGGVGDPAIESDSFDASRHNLAYYSELLGDLTARIAYTISGRVDDNSDYARYATYRVGAIGAILPGLRVRGSISSAFNAPAFNQLRPTLYTVGSAGLRPERIHSAEVGLIANFVPRLFELRANYFAQRFGDLIQYVNGSAPEFKGSYANLTAATANGYEVELDALPLNVWRASANFTVVNPRVSRVDPSYEGPDQVGDALLRRPTHSGGATVSYVPGRGTFAVAVRFVGKRPDFDFAQFPSPRVTLPAYTKVDVSAEYPLVGLGIGAVSLNARIDNLFDRRYEEVLHFATPRRAFMIGARVSSSL